MRPLLIYRYETFGQRLLPQKVFISKIEIKKKAQIVVKPTDLPLLHSESKEC